MAFSTFSDILKVLEFQLKMFKTPNEYFNQDKFTAIWDRTEIILDDLMARYVKENNKNPINAKSATHYPPPPAFFSNKEDPVISVVTNPPSSKTLGLKRMSPYVDREGTPVKMYADSGLPSWASDMQKPADDYLAKSIKEWTPEEHEKYATANPVYSLPIKSKDNDFDQIDKLACVRKPAELPVYDSGGNLLNYDQMVIQNGRECADTLKSIPKKGSKFVQAATPGTILY